MDVFGEVFTQIIVTCGALVLLFAVHLVARSAINRFAGARQLKESRTRLAHKVSRTSLLSLGAFVALSIWGVDVKNLWIFVTSVVGIVAIGFFAVWSILSNIIAGFILLVSDAFRIGDTITILPDGIQGRVTESKLMFVVLEDSNGDIYHIPNNLLFQKYIKKTANKQTEEG